MPVRAPRVMQSFKPPRATTNPFITMLDRALAAEPSIEHVRFSWRDMLLTRVDVAHFHWPEILMEGDSAAKRLAKRVLFRAMLLKLALTRAAVVRTVHNVELPEVDAPTRRLLVALEKRTDHRIVLNEVTAVGDAARTTLIPHGHYRDWFAEYPRADAVPRRIGYFGLIRRYKGVEQLLAAYAQARAADETLTLRIGGKPSSDELREVVETAAARTPGILTTLRFLDDAELVEIATSSQLVVLPYRFMHNSGGALAALSLDRPVLVPRNEVNLALAAEVGEEWVRTFEGDLTAERLCDAIAETTAIAANAGRPDLSRREWTDAGDAYAQVYRRALADRRGS